MMFESDRAYEALAPHFQKRMHRQEPLASHSSFGVGGLADLWVTVESKSELTDLVLLCVPYVFGVQANFTISHFLVTNTNTDWAVGIAYVSVALLAIMGAWAAVYTLRTGGQAETQETSPEKRESISH